MNYLLLILESLLPVAVTVIFKLLDYKTKFKKLPYWLKQTIYAIVFGGLAVFGTECGIVINGGVINVRDAPPIIAGLFFGAPAGIAAGLIGGIERLITGYIGPFVVTRAATRIACSVATILAGILAAVLRVTTRKGKKIQVVTACTLAFVIEVVHMLLVYVTNTNNLDLVIRIYRQVVGPMIVANVVATFLASWADLLIDRYFANERLFRKPQDTQLSGAIQQTTLVVAVLTFVIGFASINIIQTRISKENIETTLTSTSESVASKGFTIVNYALGGYASDLCNLVEKHKKDTDYSFIQCVEWLKEDVYGKKYEGCYEAYIVEGGAVKETSDGRSSFKDSVVDNEIYTSLLARLRTSTTNFSILEDLRESCLPDGKQVIYSIAYYDPQKAGDKYVILSMDLEKINGCVKRNRFYILGNQTYETGMTVAFGKDNTFVGSTDDTIPIDDTKDAIKLLELKGYRKLNQIKFLDNEWYSVATEGTLINVYSIVTIDKAELPARVSMYSSSFLFTFAVGLIFLVANVLIDRMIVRKMEKVGDALDKITGDKLNTKVDVYGFEEFNKLSNGINHTVDRLKGYIEEEKNRINKDLDFAKSIQKGTLPYKFPTNDNYDLHADMIPAKQVGGDFYDFFPLPNNRLFFLIADVSGKGVPAAMFMMRAETLIKSLVQTDDMSLDKVMVMVNNELCTNNDAQMFVTCWCGILDVKTGHIDFVNAGHNVPIVKRKKGKFEEIKITKNFVLAGLENIPFRLESIDLKPGDEIFIYTDGVTEDTNKSNQLYGTGRLLRFMNTTKYRTSSDMIKGIMKQLDNFHKGVDQADDITMLMIRYKPR